MNDNNNVYFIKFSMKFINLEKVKEEKLDLCRSIVNILETSVLIFLLFLISSFLIHSHTCIHTHTNICTLEHTRYSHFLMHKAIIHIKVFEGGSI